MWGYALMMQELISWQRPCRYAARMVPEAWKRRWVMLTEVEMSEMLWQAVKEWTKRLARVERLSKAGNSARAVFGGQI